MTVKVPYVQVLLERNENYSMPVWIYPWELPVFAAVHRRSGVSELRRAVFDKKFAPRADAEFERLETKYKAPEGSDISYVATIYGHGSIGVRKLQEEMQRAAEEALTLEAPAAPPVAEPDNDEFASPFGEPPALTDKELGIETQADLREFASGGESGVGTAEAVAISQ